MMTKDLPTTTFLVPLCATFALLAGCGSRDGDANGETTTPGTTEATSETGGDATADTTPPGTPSTPATPPTDTAADTPADAAPADPAPSSSPPGN